jgi:hypothetical protein
VVVASVGWPCPQEEDTGRKGAAQANQALGQPTELEQGLWEAASEQWDSAQ